MREGKFRGKAICDYEQFGIKKDEWIYGYYYKDVEEINDEQSFKHVSYIRTSYGDNYVNIEVIPETIGEYTGLKDINGKEIYEGDVVRIEYTLASIKKPFVGVVTFDRGSYLVENSLNVRGISLWDKGISIEVLGNIY